MRQNAADMGASSSASHKAIDNLAELWEAVGCRSNWTTIKPDRLAVARAAMTKATPARKAAPVVVKPVPVVDADDCVVRECDENSHELSAWSD